MCNYCIHIKEMHTNNRAKDNTLAALTLKVQLDFIQSIKSLENMQNIQIIYSALNESLSILTSLIYSFQRVTMPLGRAGWR